MLPRLIQRRRRHSAAVVIRRSGSAMAALTACAALVGGAHASAQVQSPACAPPRAGTVRLAVDPGWPAVDLHVPRALPSGERPPVVIVLGGVNQPGRAIARLTGYSALADQRHFLVAYPTARGARPSWDFATTPDAADVDVVYLRELIAALTGPGVCADPTRVLLTGMSNGGGMAARMACSAADLLAAVAPVSGGYSTLPDCQPARPLPILEIHGASDPIVPYNGRGPSHAGAVETYIAGWRARDGCTGAPRTHDIISGVTQFRWACSTGTIVENDRVAHLGHDWAGEDSMRPFSATVATWQFLSAFRSPAG